MTEPQQERQHDSALNSNRLLLVLGAIGLLLVGLWMFGSISSEKRQSEDALAEALVENEELQKQMANLQATVADIQTASLYQQEEQALAKDELSVIEGQTEELGSGLTRLAEAENNWLQTINALKDDQHGRQIASDPALVDLMEAMLNFAPPKDLAEQLTQRLGPLQQQLTQALTTDAASFKPTEAFLTRVQEIEEQGHQAERWYRDHLLQLEALKQESAELPAADRTLANALAAREAERAQQRVTTLAEQNRKSQQVADATIGKAEAEAQRMIAEAEAEAKRIVGEAAAKRIRQSAEEERAMQEEAIRKRQEAEQLAQLKRDYQRDLADIKTKLQPFLSEGYTYNGESGRKGPVSLSVLRGQGALDEGRKGLEKLLYIGGTTTNDRDRGSFPQFVGSEYAWRQLNKDFIVKAQDYLNKYGSLLVENQLLAP